MISFLKNKINNLNLDFVRWRRPAGVASTIMVLVSWVLIFIYPGPNLGIDFRGGTEIQLEFCKDAASETPIEGCNVSVKEIRSSLEQIGLPGDAVQRVGVTGSNQFMIRIEDPEFGATESIERVKKALVDDFGDTWWKSSTHDAEVGIRIAIIHEGTTVDLERVSKALELSGIDGARIEEGKEDSEVVVILPGVAEAITDQVHAAMADKPFKTLSVDAVGPKVGDDLKRQGVIALVITLGLVLIYIGFRFDIAFAPGAVLALAHDVSITMGIFVLTQREINLPMVGALLTIVGYSLNDTIVIYDRIRENQGRYRRTNLPELINVSINETLARTIATSLTTMLAISAFLFLGGSVIQDFALAMFLGIIFGTYSTVYVASPTILVMQDVKPWLMRLLATAGLQTGRDGGEMARTDEDDEDGSPAQLSSSEQRRREREDKEKQSRPSL